MNILSSFRALPYRYLRRSRRPDRAPIRKPPAWRPLVEVLEDRSMLSSIQMLALGDGTFQLRVDGDVKANQVSIVGQGPVAQTNDYSLLVSCDQLKQTVNHVSEVVIDTAGGDDTVLLTGQWAFQGKGQSGVRSISVDTGGGDDAVKFIEMKYQPMNGIAGSFDASVDLGSGDDTATFADNVFGGGLIQKVIGGNGNDTVALTGNLFQLSGVNGDSPAYLSGLLLGKGDDALIVAGNTFAGTAGYDISLDDGDDSATFAGNSYNQGLNMTLDAGDGRDTAMVAGNTYAGATLIGLLLGKGDDAATFGGNTINGVWKTTVNGDAGKDLVTIQDDSIAAIQDDSIASVFDLLIDLGKGDDTADVNVTLGNLDPAKQSVTIRVLGGMGDDDLALTVKGDPKVLAAADLLIDGGSGFDHGVGGPTVKIVNCEQ